MAKKRTTKRSHTTIQDLTKLLVLIVIDPLINQKEMAKSLNYSIATITRLLHTARNDYEMIILRPLGRGPYQIKSWGLLNQQAVLKLTEKENRKEK